MPVTDIREKFNGRRFSTGQKPGITVDFIVIGSDNDEEMIAAIYRAVPSEQYDKFTNQVLAITAIVPQEELGVGLWIWQVVYGSIDSQPQTQDFTFSFETTGGTEKKYQSIKTVGKYSKDGIDIPDYKGGIGVTQDSVEGAEIVVPSYQSSETHYFKNITNSYKITLFQLTGKTNAEPFREYDTGEALFVGASGSKRGKGDWEVTLRWRGSPNIPALQIGDLLPFRKGGWEYVWVRYVKSVIGSGANKGVGMVPKYAYLEKVYYTGDFSQLGIGS